MQNLELKCRYADLARAARLAEGTVGAVPLGRLEQTDIYFNIARGRLKLRHVRDASLRDRYELIFYRRHNRLSARTSDYQLLPIADGPQALSFFAAALGVKVEVCKERVLFLKDNLRIHLDSVPRLGTFLEFELAVDEAHPLPACRQRMQQLVELFQVGTNDLVEVSYSDLLLARQRMEGTPAQQSTRRPRGG